MGRRTSGQMYPLVEMYEQGTWSRREFCEQHKIKEASFTYWVGKYRATEEEESSFVPVQVHQEQVGEQMMEVELPEGIILRFSTLVPIEYLTSLLAMR